MIRSKKIVVSLLAIVGLAAVLSYWQVKRFAATPLTLQQETIYTLPAGTGRVALEAQLEEQRLFRTVSGLARCCVWNLNWRPSKRVPIALSRP